MNITRWSHTSVYASATARIFELAGYGACIVSQPYNGIEEWFEPGKEVIVVNSEEEAVDTYKRLLGDEKERESIATRARERVLREHTFRERARQVVRVITG